MYNMHNSGKNAERFKSVEYTSMKNRKQEGYETFPASERRLEVKFKPLIHVNTNTYQKDSELIKAPSSYP